MSAATHHHFCCNRAREQGRQTCPCPLQPCKDCYCGPKTKGASDVMLSMSGDVYGTATGFLNM